MVKHALWLALLIGGCYDDRYRCDTNEDCNLGEGGRCEVDGYCTTFDTSCDTHRRYAPHAGDLSGQCFDDRVAPINPCAGGQPPAKEEGPCYSAVCSKLETCCKVAWLDACVQLAQEAPECELQCDTQIAIMATGTAMGMTTIDRWDVRWSGNEWSHIEQRNDLMPLAWVAPAPGQALPRLSGVTGETLWIGDAPLTVPQGRTYRTLTSVPFDRDGRDTIVATFVGNGNRFEIWKLDKQVAREQGANAITMVAWGDVDRDTFPDGIAFIGNDRFGFLNNVPGDAYDRRINNPSADAIESGRTFNAPQISAFDWVDINSDGNLDLLMFGSELRIHTNAFGLGNTAQRVVDCDTPSPTRPCVTDPEPNLELAAFTGCAVPTADGPHIVMGKFPGRTMYRVEPDGTATPFPFPNPTMCGCTYNEVMCPGPTCEFRWNCNSCPAVLAMIARDLDGDHKLDLIAIDAKLALYVAKAETGYVWGGPKQIPTTFQNVFFSAVVSVTGTKVAQ
jgi:hypothetical protein